MTTPIDPHSALCNYRSMMTTTSKTVELVSGCNWAVFTVWSSGKARLVNSAEETVSLSAEEAEARIATLKSSGWRDVDA